MSKLANPFQSGAHAKKKECPFCRAGNRVKQAFAFFADLIKNYLSAAERAFGIKDLSSAVLAVLCGIVILAALIAEPHLGYELTEPVLSPVEGEVSPELAPADSAEPNRVTVPEGKRVPLTAQSLVYIDKTKPVRVEVPADKQVPLTSAAIAEPEPAAIRASIDFGTIKGTNSERASYLKSNVNSDVIGWLQIPNTNIDYPVMQGYSLYTYMSADIYGNYDYDGSLWVDTDVNDWSNNTVIFGHNWTNYSSNPAIGRPSDVMFAQLTAFQHDSFARQNPYFYYSTTSQNYVAQIFAAGYTTDLNFYLWTNTSASTLSNIISRGRSLSLHDYDVSVSSSDRIVTLSTCTRYFGNFADQRFIVMAKLVPIN